MGSDALVVGLDAPIANSMYRSERKKRELEDVGGGGVLRASCTVTGVVLSSIAGTSIALSPALPFDTVTACLQLTSGTLELTPESKRTLTAFVKLLSPVAQRTQWAGATLSRSVVGADLQEPPFLSDPEGVYVTTSRKYSSGRVHSTQSQIYQQATARILMSKILSLELAEAQTVSFGERHSTDPAGCQLELAAHALLGPTPPTFRVYDCTPDGCKERAHK
jgi:hypothetical protein